MIQNQPTQNNLLTYPINHDNEGLIISNALKNEENREIFYRKVTFDKFRVKEFQTIAWGIIETITSKLAFNLDAVLLKSKTCPVRYTVEYTFLQELVKNFDEVPSNNYLEHLETLSTDYAKHQLIELTLRSILPACTNPKTKMSDLETRITSAKTILERGRSAMQLNFKTMSELAVIYDEMKSKGFDKRTTGFHQLDYYLTEGFKEGQITTVAGLASMGKCEIKGTEIIMFDCSFKKIEDIKIGDSLMGPDSQPRKVLSITKGFGKLYRIHQKRGEDYYVTENHILSLKRAGASIRTRVGANKKGKRKIIGWKDNGEIINISVKDALKQSGNYFNKHKGYKAILNFPERSLKIDPYFLGIWIGDGHSSGVTISNPDKEIRNYLKGYAIPLGMIYHEDNLKDKKHCSNCRISNGKYQKNYLLDSLRFYDLIKNKHIPNEYLYNSKENRMLLLAGLLDSDGYMTSGIHEISTKYEKLKNDILFLGRSLGFYCTASYEKKKIRSTKFEGMYWRIRICGYNYLIPNKVKRKKAYQHKKKYLPTSSTIEISYHKKDYFFGFELDKDGLYIHKDFTVTHNSSLALSFMKNLSQLVTPVPTAQFALEMNNMSLFTKLLAFQSMLPINRVVKKPEELNNEERQIYMFEKERLAKNKFIFLNDTPFQTIAAMREQIMLLQDLVKQSYTVVVIDLYGKIGDLQSSDNFARDYEKNLNLLQVITRDLGIHLILVAQINREVGKRKNKRPTMNDLKNSGALVEVSDIVLGIHRPYYDSELAARRKAYFSSSEDEEESTNEYASVILDDTLDTNLAEVIVLKQRMGPKDDIINFIFDPDTTCFRPISESYQKKINQRRMEEEALD
jgi:replicative DNA helicase